MKNPNGFGTVYKSSEKRRKPWIARKTIGYDPITGTQLKKTIGYFETKKEAMEALYNYSNKPERLFTDKMTFKDVFELWKKTHYTKIAPATIKQYDKFYNSSISIYFDDLVFKDIKLVQIQLYIDSLNYSKATIKVIKAILKNIWNFGIKNDFIDKNLIDLIDIKNTNDKLLKRVIFNKKEIQILWDNMELPYVDTILILIYTGMRIGELLNLKNTDINLEEKYILTEGSKTEAGKNRIIPINNKIFSLITKRMSIKNKYLIEYKNSPLKYNTYREKFKKILKKLNLENHTVHDTRHTFASLLSDANANRESIKKIIGHSSFSTTERIYTHKGIEELRKAIESI